ncbi:MAG TPA: YfiR family protein [Flavisolibacter sp.]|nr:YfiR family protein [Flavisolibacter sp.]
MSRRHFNIIRLVVLLLWTGSAFSLRAQAPSTANQLKAVFLYNFTQFVDWPANSFSSSTSPFVIGILGENPFGSYLSSVVEGEKAGSHPIIVRHFNSVKEIGNCHILFINRKEASSAIKHLENRSILTVGDESDFIRSGGMIRFFIRNNKIRLQINLKAAKASGLNISSKLLRVADVVN